VVDVGAGLGMRMVPIVEQALFSELAWMPDGHRIAFNAATDDPDDIDDEIRIYDLDTDPTEVVHTDFAINDVDVSPDGSTIAYSSTGADGILLVPVE
ncbi:MAG TPA: hypothetical protein VL172_20750, partial [Kofleriaceae bacterium]|nr:hypothetical protein [Kofleriaceae bacterium]